MNKKFSCPYCNNQVSPKELLGICSDTKCQAYFNHAYSMFKNEATCPECHQHTVMKACPHCREEIPANYASDNRIIITVVGSKESGKSHYIAALIDSLNFGFSRKFGFSIIPANEKIIKKYTYGLYEKVYREKTKVAATASAVGGVESGSETAFPYIYTMNFVKNSAGKKRTRKSVSLVIYDTAGEDLKKTDDIRGAAVEKHIKDSNGIIYMFDPLQVDFIRNQFDKEDLPVNVDNDFVVPEQLLALLMQNRKLMQKKPFAFTVSKFDQIKHLLENQHTCLSKEKSGHAVGNGIVISEFEEIDGVLSDFFRDDLFESGKKRADSVINKFEDFFIDMCKFAVSALGSKIDKNGRIKDNAKPYRVEDPFLWILYKNKIIKPNK